MIDEALCYTLTNDTTVKALINDRVYAIRAPQNPTLPLITYEMLDSPFTHTLDGARSEKVVMLVNCWAKKKIDAMTLAAAVVEALDCVNGEVGEDGKEENLKILVTNKEDVYEPGVSDFRVSLEFNIWHNPD